MSQLSKHRKGWIPAWSKDSLHFIWGTCSLHAIEFHLSQESLEQLLHFYYSSPPLDASTLFSVLLHSHIHSAACNYLKLMNEDESHFSRMFAAHSSKCLRGLIFCCQACMPRKFPASPGNSLSSAPEHEFGLGLFTCPRGFFLFCSLENKVYISLCCYTYTHFRQSITGLTKTNKICSHTHTS